MWSEGNKLTDADKALGASRLYNKNSRVLVSRPPTWCSPCFVGCWGARLSVRVSKPTHDHELRHTEGSCSQRAQLFDRLGFLVEPCDEGFYCKMCAAGSSSSIEFE